VEHSPIRSAAAARILFAVGVGAIGCQTLLGGDFVAELQPVPAWMPARGLLAVVMGMLLVGPAACLVAGRRVRAAAAWLGSVLFLVVALLHLPRLALDPSNGGAWTGAFEVLALGGGAWVMAGPATERIGRRCFALSLPVFGALHFIYSDYVAFVIPAWIPAHYFWAYVTGAAHIAAGASIASGVRARLAATLLAVMFGSWVLILHVPRVAASLDGREEWTSLFVAMAMCGASWLIAGSLGGRNSAAQRAG
jgi:uncharacterized membrane protein YphA (DoxX/SURF4 family)